MKNYRVRLHFTSRSGAGSTDTVTVKALSYADAFIIASRVVADRWGVKTRDLYLRWIEEVEA